MTTNKNKKTDAFWDDVFNPEGNDLIDVRKHLLVGQYLKQIEDVLNDKKITRSALAEKIEVSPSYLSQLFHGDKLPSWKLLAKIEIALDIKFELKSRKIDKNIFYPFSTDFFSEKEPLTGVSMNDDFALKIA